MFTQEDPDAKAEQAFIRELFADDPDDTPTPVEVALRQTMAETVHSNSDTPEREFTRSLFNSNN